MHEDLSRFDEPACGVLVLADQEAQRFNHNYIGTEHLLLGLTRQEEGIAADVLHEVAVDLAKVRRAVEFIIGRGERQVMGDIGLTPRAKKVLELARDESRRLGHDYIGSEHILLGLIREGEGIAAGVLESLGVHLEWLRTAVIRVLTAGPSAGEEVPAAPERARTRREGTWQYLVVPTISTDGQVYAQQFFNPRKDIKNLAGMHTSDMLTYLGALGWELAAIDPRHRSGDRAGSLYIFKRRGSDERQL